jgi:putative ABC transport system ATP-binding protein
MRSSYLIETRDLVKTYSLGESTIMALNKVSLDFERAEFTGLVGPSGSGKTTLLNIIGSLDSPTSGSAVVMGRKVEDLSHKEAASLRNHHIGFIFQTFNLLPVYTVFENVEFPLLLLEHSPGERRKMTMEALDWVGLADRAKSRPAQLSGGQSQRVAIARAVVKKPALILADEPTANLDSRAGHEVMGLLGRIAHDQGRSVIVCSHDARIREVADTVLWLEDGQLTGAAGR